MTPHAPTADAPLDDWLAWVSMQHPQSIAMGLDRVRSVAERLGLPTKPAPLTLIVAGTNGKGSSLAYLRAILGAAGLRVASYLSPHLLDFRERLQLGRDYASAAQWTSALARVDAARGSIPLTYFEATTLAALSIIGASDLDAAVLEVGLGGRLDAVNLVDADGALLTTVDLDHQAYLGSDRDSIGVEKAGVFRPGRPAVYAEVDAVPSVLQCAAAVGTPLILAGRDYRIQRAEAQWTLQPARGEPLHLPHPALSGQPQIDNAAGCIMLLEALADRWPRDPSAYAEGLQRARMPGRLQQISSQPPITVDVAHNPQAAAVLAQALGSLPVPKVAVFGVLDDKDLPGIVTPLLAQFAQWHCVGLDGISPRGRPAEPVAATLRAAGAQASAHADVATGLAAARAQLPDSGQIIAFGSFLTVAGTLTACGMTTLPPLP